MADRRLRPFSRGKAVTLLYEGDPVRAFEGEPIAVALFAAGTEVLSRSIKYHRPRSFFCLDGHCAACFMRIDAVPNVRSCRTLVREGIACERQNAFPSAGFDLLGAADWLFPSGMDHHTLLAKQPLLRPVLEKMVREIGGLGRLPDAPAQVIPAPQRRHVEVLVLGGGPAGLACAEAAARRGRQVCLVDEDDRPGGSLWSEPEGSALAASLATKAVDAGTTMLGPATALGWFPEDDGGLIPVATSSELVLISADRTVHATGTYAQNILCEDNDRPGVVAARAVGRLLFRYGVLPGRAIALVGPSSYGDRLGPALESAGVRTIRAASALRTHGSPWVESIELESGVVHDCDLVAACAEPLAASDLARQQGTKIQDARGAFAIDVDERGQTSVKNVLACGEVAGSQGPWQALESGAALGARV